MEQTTAANRKSSILLLERLFGLAKAGTNPRTEFVAGLTTFLTMVYIVFVNPQILCNTGMDKGAVFVATCIAAAVSTLMALYANYPIALAPGMGLGKLFKIGEDRRSVDEFDGAVRGTLSVEHRHNA